ncbi:hypothetical protein [Aliarcobacter butzleri]|uniref:hypothetical protein n=1 Tax=Aliarcobacter butzleri TaxID=28197 RepID=UPI00263BED8B|nr:hypothetical protein [Aliarcobacter butzleri]MDN5053800.1 hypothetical protein [Aliarcobacter butzleri]
MRKFYNVFMEEMSDGTASTGMGATTTTETAPAVQTTTMSESEALNFLSGANNVNNEQQPNVNEEQTIQPQESNDFNINLDEIDMSMFGNFEEQVNQNIQNQQTQQQVQQTQMQEQNPNTQLLEQLLEKLNNNQNQTPPDEDIEALSLLATKMQKAGLLPSGISEEDKQLLQEIKAVKDELNQQKEIQKQQVEHQNKINAIDNFSKELEQTIPNYNNDFMIQLVSKIAQQNPQAGQQILNNPAMLISLWNKYGAKAQPKVQQTNILSSNGSGSNNVNTNELFERVKTGKATQDEELRLIASL